MYMFLHGSTALTHAGGGSWMHYSVAQVSGFSQCHPHNVFAQTLMSLQWKEDTFITTHCTKLRTPFRLNTGVTVGDVGPHPLSDAAKGKKPRLLISVGKSARAFTFTSVVQINKGAESFGRMLLWVITVLSIDPSVSHLSLCVSALSE